MLLSIVIPVYNVEKYLERCVLSVLDTKLSTNDFEILLVNDGSTDNSPALCNQFEKEYKNIRTYHKKNGGLSDARNYGILKARGQYIGFVDSDDFISKDAYTILLENALRETADIVIGNAYKYIDSNNIYLKFKKRHHDYIIENGISFLVQSIKNNTMSMSVVLGIYSKDWILNKNLFFKKNLLHEDELWTPTAFIQAKKVIYINHDFYYHFERKGSITQSKNKTKNALDLIQICYILDSIYNEIPNWRFRKILKNYLCMLYLNAAYLGKLKDELYDVQLNKLFPIKRSWSIKNIMKSFLFMLNRDLYYKVNSTSKSLK